MHTQQIEESATRSSIPDGRYGVINETPAPPRALRSVTTCRPNGFPTANDSKTRKSATAPILATAFLEDLRDAIVALDIGGRCLYVNRAFETMTGFCRADLLGTPLGERIDPTQEASWSSLARMFGAPSNAPETPPVGPLHVQFKMHRADSSSFDLDVRWDRFPGSRSIAASFLLCKELMTVESELQARMMDLRILRDELNALLEVTKIDESSAFSRWQAHTTKTNETARIGPARSELSRREQEVLHSVLDGKRVGTIATALFLSENTVRNHLKRIYRKLGVGSLGELREHCSNV
jgi:DNA-binding CsgD family transcriptional regulator/PAS domain-containing protein